MNEIEQKGHLMVCLERGCVGGWSNLHTWPLHESRVKIKVNMSDDTLQCLVSWVTQFVIKQVPGYPTRSFSSPNQEVWLANKNVLVLRTHVKLYTFIVVYSYKRSAAISAQPIGMTTHCASWAAQWVVTWRERIPIVVIGIHIVWETPELHQNLQIWIVDAWAHYSLGI